MKIVILGAGPSGLGAAWGLIDRGESDILVLEKEASVGGLSRSIRWEDATVDIGPHRFSPEFPDLVAKIGDILGEDWLQVPNQHAVVFQDRVYRYPPVLSDFLNGRTLLLCVRVLLSFVLCRVQALFAKQRSCETFESRIVARFGRVFYKEVVGPMASKVWGDPKRLDPDFANLRFSVPTIVQWYKKLVGHPDTFNDKFFYYPRHGFQQLWDGVSDHLCRHGARIVTQAEVTQLLREGERISELRYLHEGEEIAVRPDFVVSTIPNRSFLPVLGKLGKGNGDGELPGRFQFQDKGMILIAFLIRRPRALPERVVIFPEARYPFNRLSEQNLFSRDTVPAGYSAVVADILEMESAGKWPLPDERLIEESLAAIESLGFFSRPEVVSTQVLRFPIAYPVPTVERESSQSELNRHLSSVKNLICTGRFASTDYNNSHTALKKGMMAAEFIVQGGEVADWYRMSEEIRRRPIRD